MIWLNCDGSYVAEELESMMTFVQMVWPFVAVRSLFDSHSVEEIFVEFVVLEKMPNRLIVIVVEQRHFVVVLLVDSMKILIVENLS